MGIDRSSPVTVACLFVIVCELLAGMFSNLFILFVFLSDLYKEKIINSGNKIQVAINLSNMVLIIGTSFNVFYLIFCQERNAILTLVCNLLTLYGFISCLFLTTVLCFFWFIKIVQFNSGILSWMKRKVNSLIFWLIMAVESFSFSVSCLNIVLYTVYQEPLTNTSVLTNENATLKKSSGSTANVFFSTMTLFLVPYLFMLVTSISAAGFLYLHSRKIRKMKTSSDVSRYKSTIYKIMRVFFLHTLFCGVWFFDIFSGLSHQGPGFWFVYIILAFYFLAHSLFLIFENNKLRNTWKKIFHCVFS